MKSLSVLVRFFVAIISLHVGVASGASPWALYQSSLHQRPLLTKTITAASIMSISDIASQSIVKDKECLDWKRVAQVATTGFIWSAPLAHYWYGTLEKVVPHFMDSSKNKTLGVMVRLVLESMLFSPLAVAGYLILRTLFEGQGLGQVKDKLRTKWKTALLASWKFWNIASVANYAIVPLPFRVLYVNSLSLLWNGYMTYLNSLKIS